ncbi:hypothetical protein Q0F98_02340 [Paenibacillus amylolyticus]|nr:hypothetical protein Q0F98_02340 [Paenibacillus amylolyticus]
MLGSVELIRNWFQMASDGEAHASVRFGDASNTILAHDTVLTMDFIKSHYGWLNDPTYCGITLPNASERNYCTLPAKSGLRWTPDPNRSLVFQAVIRYVPCIL